MNIGVQTFTIRKAQKKSIKEAYLPLIKLGIKSFEVARIDFTPENASELKTLAHEYGIEVKSIQVKPRYVFGESRRIIEFCKTVGCTRVVISMLPFECILGKEEKFYSFLAGLDECFELYARDGITLAYHHHNWEYITLSNGRTRMAELLSLTKKIKFVHDTYWTAGCGIAPERQIAEFGDRLLGIHLRDLTHRKSGIKVLQKDCAIGDGVIDFGSVLRAAKEVGCEYLVIEQKTDKPYEEIKKSYERCLAIEA